jgi:transposase
MRATFQTRVTRGLVPMLKRLHFVDEIGMHLGLTRLYGWAAPGQRVVEATPGYSGLHYTAVAALNLRGVQAPWVLEGGMNGLAFQAYVQHVLGPQLRRGDIVVLDNLAPHKHAVIQQLLAARGPQLEFLPPYSPDLNPIEQCWSKIKQALRAAKSRTYPALIEALAHALRSVSRQDAAAWFAHCGYAVNTSG